MENLQKATKTQGREVYTPDYIPESVRLGVYSNVANITATDNEITILFMQQDRNGTTAVSKVILPIKHVQSLVDVLSSVLEQIKNINRSNA